MIEELKRRFSQQLKCQIANKRLKLIMEAELEAKNKKLQAESEKLQARIEKLEKALNRIAGGE